jgi:UDP-N-acetylmuramyl pentapeptide phosphotransferase/UDP-N-acetylglucosamine-1-phosphate transferase
MGLLSASIFAPLSVQTVLVQLIIAGLPALFFGLAEDLTKRVGVRERLLATMVSGVVAWYLTGISLGRADVWGLDLALRILPISILFTAFAVGGVANAINIIDGCHGLAAGAVLISLAALGIMAEQVGDQELSSLICIVGSVALGFLLINFPFGKLFLGDGGAYFLGFILAWLAVMLPTRNPSISAWASFLACGYPILEVCFSIARRFAKAHSPGHPDRLHLHSLIQSRVINKRLRHWRKAFSNAAVSPVIWLYALLPAIFAIVFKHSTPLLILSFALCLAIYWAVYSRLVNFRWKLKWPTFL